jgi:hypothetical protein
MDAALVAALIAGFVAIVSAGVSIWGSFRVERIKAQNDTLKEINKYQKELSKYKEPLARAAFELQNRIHNITHGAFIETFLVNGNARERAYAINNTAYVIAQYFCWTEKLRADVVFIDMESHERTRELSKLLDNINRYWAADIYGRLLRIFAGEQRAIGEALFSTEATGLECIGYGAFLKKFSVTTDPLIDAIREDVESLGKGIGPAAERLKLVYESLNDLLDMLDPKRSRFPLRRRGV